VKINYGRCPVRRRRSTTAHNLDAKKKKEKLGAIDMRRGSARVRAKPASAWHDRKPI
jgi:hypothetical protein